MDINQLLKKVEDYAEIILNGAYNSKITYPIDLNKITKALNLKAYHSPLSDNICGFFKVADGNVGIIINDNQPENRQRFTLAHEIGHYISYKLQNKSGELIDFRDTFSTNGTNPEEIFANKFAAALLMPRAEVLKLLGEHKTVTQLCHHFKVSEQAIKIRLANLAL